MSVCIHTESVFERCTPVVMERVVRASRSTMEIPAEKTRARIHSASLVMKLSLNSEGKERLGKGGRRRARGKEPREGGPLGKGRRRRGRREGEGTGEGEGRGFREKEKDEREMEK